MKPRHTFSMCRASVAALALLVAVPLAASDPPTPSRPAPVPVAPVAPVAPAPPEPPCPRIVVNGQVVGGEARGFLGVEPTRLSPELRAHFGLPADRGVLVGEILEGSAAEAAGLRVGDLVTRVGETSIDSAWSLSAAVAEREGGESIAIEYWRDGATRTTTAVLDTKERCAFDLGSALPLEALRELEALEDLDFDFDFDFDFEGDIEIDEAEIERLTEQSMAAATLAIEEAMQALDEVDWEQELQGLEELEELELEAMEQRMEAIQERMEALERELETEGRKLKHESRRELERQRRALEQEQREVEREQQRMQSRQVSMAREEARREMAEARAELEQELAEVAADRAEVAAEVAADRAAAAAESRAAGGDSAPR